MKKPRPKRVSAQLKVAWLGKGGAGIRTQIFLTLNPKEVISDNNGNHSGTDRYFLFVNG